MGALIWLASYPKSGNTWMRTFLHNLLRDAQEPVPLDRLDEFCLGEAFRSWAEPHTDRPLEELPPGELARIRLLGQADMTKVFPDSVFVKTHNYLGTAHGYPLINMEVTAGAIYVVRNPLDVVLSARHHFNVDIDRMIGIMGSPRGGSPMNEFLMPEVFSTWSEHVRSWTARPSAQLFIVRYEDLLDDPLRHFGAVVRFLGLAPSSERLERAVRLSSFDSLKRLEKTYGFREKPTHAEAFFRAGKAGQWEEALSRDQVRRIISVHSQQMKRFGYIPDDYRDAIPTDADAQN